MHNFTCQNVFELNYVFSKILGTASEFRKRFENPILRGRDADATDADHEKGETQKMKVTYFICKTRLKGL